MRFLLDENLSPRLADLLRSAGHDVNHVCDLGLSGADDRSIMAAAASDGHHVTVAREVGLSSASDEVVIATACRH